MIAAPVYSTTCSQQGSVDRSSDTRDKAKSYMGLKGQSEKMDEYEINTQIQVDKLCRGGQMRVIETLYNYLTTILILFKSIT